MCLTPPLSTQEIIRKEEEEREVASRYGKRSGKDLGKKNCPYINSLSCLHLRRTRQTTLEDKRRIQMVHIQLHFSWNCSGRKRRRRSSVTCCIPKARQAGRGNSHNPLYCGRVLERRRPSATEGVGPPQSSRYQFFILFLSFLASFKTTEACWTQSQPPFFFFFCGEEGLTQGWRMSRGWEEGEGAVKRLSRLMLTENILIAKLNQPASQPKKPEAEVLRSFMDSMERHMLVRPWCETLMITSTHSYAGVSGLRYIKNSTAHLLCL